jgi:hypothetical protein
MPAARIGPTVCELEGPMPILKRSKTLIAKVYLPDKKCLRYSMLFKAAVHDSSRQIQWIIQARQTTRRTGKSRLFYNAAGLGFHHISV